MSATDSPCPVSGAGRDCLVAARVALFEADLALAMGNPRAARIQIDLAQDNLADLSKDLQAAERAALAAHCAPAPASL